MCSYEPYELPSQITEPCTEVNFKSHLNHKPLIYSFQNAYYFKDN